jgi:hypothetical protein
LPVLFTKAPAALPHPQKYTAATIQAANHRFFVRISLDNKTQITMASNLPAPTSAANGGNKDPLASTPASSQKVCWIFFLYFMHFS